MIARAVDSQGEERGASRQWIKKYLETNYKIPPTSPHLKRAMRQLLSASEGSPRLITKGKKTGTYFLSPELKYKIDYLV